MPVTLHVPADDGAVDDAEGGKQCRRAVPLVVVGRGAGPPFLQAQTGLGAVGRLDLALLIDRQHGGTSAVRRIWNAQSLQPHRWRIVALQRPAVRPMAYARRRRHNVGSPVRRLGRRFCERQRHHPIADLRPERSNARGARLVAKRSSMPSVAKRSCRHHTDLRLAGLPHELDGADTIGTQQDDLGAPDALFAAYCDP